jgi:hypothetical protein
MHVIPAKAGIYNYLIILDPRLRGDDKKRTVSTFYEFVKVGVGPDLSLVGDLRTSADRVDEAPRATPCGLARHLNTYLRERCQVSHESIQTHSLPHLVVAILLYVGKFYLTSAGNTHK